MALLIACIMMTLIVCGCLESGSDDLITGEAKDMVLSVEDLPGWEAHDMGEPDFVLCNNSVEFHFAPQGEYNEYLPKLRIIIAVYEDDVILKNGTTWGPIERSEWVYEAKKDGDPHDIFSIDLGEEGYYSIDNSTIDDDPLYTSAIYAFRTKNVWVRIDFIDLEAGEIPYWGWMEDIARLQESLILG